MAVKICKALNKIFPLPVHPFNLQNEGKMTYARWQHARGADTIKFYLDKTDAAAMFKDKTVVDIGCGAAGKTLYYADHGVAKIYGVEILEKYRDEANSLAAELGHGDKFEFVCADAAGLPFADGTIDTVIMNDAMEHVDEPAAVLQELVRVLAPGGRIFLNFPPYYHPHGAHLSDAIGIPWVHMLFNDKTLIKVYKDAVKDLPDGENRIDFRIGTDLNGEEYFTYINKMTVKGFRRILAKTGIRPAYYKEVPLRGFMAGLAKIPLVKEMFIKMVVCIIEK